MLLQTEDILVLALVGMCHSLSDVCLHVHVGLLLVRTTILRSALHLASVLPYDDQSSVLLYTLLPR